MKTNKIVLLIVISFISLYSFSQSLTTKTIEELEKMKKEAIISENYELANKINEEQKSRVSLDDKLNELNKNLKVAVANENFEEAEKLKNEIKKVEEKKAKLNQLEEEKKAAILIEDFEKVIALEKQINDLKNDRNHTPAPTTTNNNYTANNNTSTEQTNPSTNTPANNTRKEVAMGFMSTNQNPTIDPAGFMSMATMMQAAAVTLTSSEVTPNGDGVNDFLTFQNLEKYPNNTLIITGNKGVPPYQITNYQNNWGGENQVAGTYYYNLRINGRKPQKGAFILKK